MSVRRYRIESFCDGAVWAITRLTDGASVVLQGDDAIYFGKRLESTTEAFTDDDVCDLYADALYTPVNRLIGNFARVIEQRDALLEACEIVSSSTCGDVGEDGYEGCIRIQEAALVAVRAAIAICSGEAVGQ